MTPSTGGVVAVADGHDHALELGEHTGSPTRRVRRGDRTHRANSRLSDRLFVDLPGPIRHRSHATSRPGVGAPPPRSLRHSHGRPDGPWPRDGSGWATLDTMAAQYIYTMRDLRRFYPPDREVLKGINLSFYPGAKIGVIGGNGSGKSSLLRIMAGEDDGFTGEARLTAGFTVGHLAQEPQLDPAKDVLGNVSDGVGEAKALVDRFNEVCAAMGEPDADFDKLLAEQAELQDKIDAAGAWDLERTFEIAMDALRLPPGDAEVATLSGGERRRVALCRLLLSKPDLLLLDEPTNHLDAESVAWLERTLQDYPGHRGGRDPRPVLPRQRGRLDPRAGPRGGHSLGGQLLVVARAEAGPTGRGAEGGPVPPAGPPAGAGVDPDVAPGPPVQGQGPHQRLQRPGGRGRGGRAAGRQAGDHHPLRATPGRPGGRRRGPGQGVRRPAADRRALVPAAPGGIVGRHRPQRGRQDHPLPDDGGRGEARRRIPRGRHHRAAGLRRPVAGRTGRGRHGLRRDHRRPGPAGGGPP